MRNGKWLVLMAAVLACGLIAAGCGDDDDSSSTVATPTEESTTEESTTADETTTEESDDSGDSTASTPDDIYNACMDVIEGTPAEAAGETACAQARDAFEQCAQQADAIDDDAGRETGRPGLPGRSRPGGRALEAAG